MSSGKPTPFFYIAVVLVIGGLVYFAADRMGIFGEKEQVVNNGGGGSGGEGELDPSKMGVTGAEQADDSDIATTVKEYVYVPAERLPEVKGTAAYQPMENRTVQFALNVWAGWAPIIYANNGFAAEKVWTTPSGEDFKVQLVLADDPVAMRDGYATGNFHIGWATVDMLPLFMEGFVDASGKPKDSRVMPRIFQQIDWSNGGDGIVVRESIRTVSDLKGKKIVLAQNSPSQYFALSMLVAGGVQPSEVEFVYTGDAFQAAAAFNSNKDIAACVSWAPDIYNLSEAGGNRMLVTTQTANKLIADVWFARADFAQEHPDIIEGLVRGIFDAMVELKDQANQQKAAALMAEGYALPASETQAMLADAHSTNYAENSQFFMNQNNPARFEAIWNQAYYVYRQIRSVTHQPVSFDQVVDFSVLQKLGKEEKYSSQTDEYRVTFVPKTTREIEAESPEVLTNTVIIQFAPNKSDMMHKVTRKKGDGTEVEELYDPNVNFILDEIGRLVGQFSAARVVIEGHTDASMKSVLPDDTAVKELANERANSVKQELVRKHNLDPNQFNVKGVGWDEPADPNDPNNHAKNRRVEIRVFSPEQG